MNYPKRLIEVDLPIQRISENARQEKKAAGHGHITTIHIWWSRKPLGVCRSITAASLWLAPSDKNCPKSFITGAKGIIYELALHSLHLFSSDTIKRYSKYRKKKELLDKPAELEKALLDLIADISDTGKLIHKEIIDAVNKLTIISHEALGNVKNSRPFVLDPFAGGGSIPIEASRIGADAFSSDLNPVAVIINKILLEYLPKVKEDVPSLIEKWGNYIVNEVKKDFKDIYPELKDGAYPVAYVYARSVKCEGPGCGAKIPMISSPWLQKKSKTKVALKIVPDVKKKQVNFEIINNPKKVDAGTCKRGSVICPCCGYTTPVNSVRAQFIKSGGGTHDAQLLAVVYTKHNVPGRIYKLPTDLEYNSIKLAKTLVEKKEKKYLQETGKIPLSDELPLMSGVFNVPIYGIDTWRKLYSNRQYLLLLSLAEKIASLSENKDFKKLDNLTSNTIIACLGLVHSKLCDLANSLCHWEPNVPTVQNLYGRQSIGMSWNFAEGNIFGDSRGSWDTCLSGIVKVIEQNRNRWNQGSANLCDAAKHILPDDSVNAVITDPPYYNSIPYADLSEMFYLWHKITLSKTFPDLYELSNSPKEQEICEMSGWDEKRYAHKDKIWFEDTMTLAMKECRRVLSPSGIAVIIFAHKSTAGWEAMLQSILNAGWVITASWPVDTELGTRLRGMNSAALASSVNLVCRPKENEDGSQITDHIGDWRDVLRELPVSIHDWMIKLESEKIIGSDAIFACLGPALEIFSRYSSVEKPNGDIVSLREYLEQVWAAVSQEALTMVFKNADVKGFEEDARLTAMWLWTLKSYESEIELSDDSGSGSDSEDDESSSSMAISGYTLEYDTARKISQGLGAHIDSMQTLVQIDGVKARLLPVEERTAYLFGISGLRKPPTKKKKNMQLEMFEALVAEDETSYLPSDLKIQQTGKTVLDRLHQSMLLYSAGRIDALKRFLVEDGVGKDDRFWKLAQAFTALYPTLSQERRWVEGVQTFKKSLGF